MIIQYENKSLTFNVKGTMFKVNIPITPDNRLGDGTYGVVYKGTLQEGQNPPINAAFKIVPYAYYGAYYEPSAKSEFQSEIEITKILGNHSICPNLYLSFNTNFKFGADSELDRDTELECGVLCMQYIQGNTLTQWITKHSNEPYATQVLTSFCEKVSKMHDLNILHNDLGTDNIMVEELTKRAYIIDMGFAQVIPVADLSNLTEKNTIITKRVGDQAFMNLGNARKVSTDHPGNRFQQVNFRTKDKDQFCLKASWECESASLYSYRRYAEWLNKYKVCMDNFYESLSLTGFVKDLPAIRAPHVLASLGPMRHSAARSGSAARRAARGDPTPLWVARQPIAPPTPASVVQATLNSWLLLGSSPYTSPASAKSSVSRPAYSPAYSP
jgi:serine/threonine protein kinase